MKAITQILTLTLFLLPSAQLAATGSFQSGLDAYHADEFGTAYAEFKRALAEDESAAVRHNLALAAFRGGDISEAVWQLERAALLAPLNREYQFKLGALRQEIGLLHKPPAWYEIAASTLPLNQWILIGNLAAWIMIATFFVPWVANSKVGIVSKLTRFLASALTLISLPMIGLSLQKLDQAVLITDASVELHAAPASAAPVTGTGRAGERANILQSHRDYIEIKTEGGVTGWIEKDNLRKLTE